MDDVAAVILVLFSQMFQYPDLLLGLSVEPLLVPHHLEGHMEMSLVVVDLQNLSEGALANHF